MKISKIVEIPYHEKDHLKKFDFKKKVKKQNRLLMPLIWLLSFPEVFKRKTKITKINMKSLKKEPYLLLCNHNAFFDFKVATKAIFPRRATYIVAIDGFINREGIMREVGCFGKRKFIQDRYLISQIKRSLHDLKHICMIYPEARYSHVGTTSIMPESLGKLVKLLNVPVATLITSGNHLSQPVWNLQKRNVHTEAKMTYLLSKEDIASMDYQEINNKINEAFVYDDYRWQQTNQIQIKEPFRAEGLEHVLYQCPHCLAEGKMTTKNDEIKCENCEKKWTLTQTGFLETKDGTLEFSHIPDWYEWQRHQLKKAIDQGTYHFEHDVNINVLQSSEGFYQIGKGKLIHNLEGFIVEGKSEDESFTLKKEPLENYSVHVEYNYFGRGQGISFSDLKNTYYMFSNDKSYLVTKVHFAVEELYQSLVSVDK